MPIQSRFSTQHPPKSIDKSIPKSVTTLINFGKCMGSNLAPNWRPRRPKKRPRSPKKRPKAPKDHPGQLPRRSQDTPGNSQNANERFSTIFGRCFMDLRICVEFQMIFDQMSNRSPDKKSKRGGWCAALRQAFRPAHGVQSPIP